MKSLGDILADIRYSKHKSAAHLIHINTVLAILASENKVRIAAHLIHSNTALATLSSENKEHINLCLTTQTYYLHSNSLKPQCSYLNTRFLSK